MYRSAQLERAVVPGRERKKKVVNTVVTKLGCDKADRMEFEMWLPADVLIFLHRLSAGCQEPR